MRYSIVAMDQAGVFALARNTSKIEREIISRHHSLPDFKISLQSRFRRMDEKSRWLIGLVQQVEKYA